MKSNEEIVQTLRMVEHDLKLMMAYINTQEEYVVYVNRGKNEWTSLEKARHEQIKSFAVRAVERIQELTS